jgi:hypothetical protein
MDIYQLIIIPMQRTIAGVTGAAALLAAGFVFAGTEKIAVCHFTGSEGNPFEVISIADRAFPAHEEHGDFALPESGVCEDGGGGGGDPQ